MKNTTTSLLDGAQSSEFKWTSQRTFYGYKIGKNLSEEGFEFHVWVMIVLWLFKILLLFFC